VIHFTIKPHCKSRHLLVALTHFLTAGWHSFTNTAGRYRAFFCQNHSINTDSAFLYSAVIFFGLTCSHIHCSSAVCLIKVDTEIPSSWSFPSTRNVLSRILLAHVASSWINRSLCFVLIFLFSSHDGHIK
jgi:hypothetical protein